MSRISYRNYPTLLYMNMEIKKGSGRDIKIHEIDADNEGLKKDSLKMIQNLLSEKTKVTSVSKNFVDTVKGNYSKMNDIINKELNDDETILIYETFIIDGFIIHTKQTLSKIQFNVDTAVFEKDGLLISTYSKDKWSNDDIKLWETKSRPYFFELDNNRYNIAIYFTILTLHIVFFRMYASVEIVESKAKSKTKIAGCKYLNETDHDIEYLDSKWFTTLVKSEGFKVRGFFRMQPKKKDGEWTKELIWIDEFEKKGYTRQAKILNHE